MTGDDLLDAPLGRRRMKVPRCSCGYSGKIGEGLHAPDCERWVAIVQKYAPGGLTVEKGRVVAVASSTE
jgi:hypothetical protein